MKCPHCNKEFSQHEKAVVEFGNVYHDKCLKARDMAANGYPYECPSCKGKGHTIKEYNKYPQGLPDSGWVYEPGYTEVECDLCKGRGYNARQYKPKMIQQGWE